MRRAAVRRLRPRYLVLIAVPVALAVLLALFIGRIGAPDDGLTPEALHRIEAQNRKAASQAAAVQRAESEASAQAADREADLRDAGNNAAPLTRFETANATR